MAARGENRQEKILSVAQEIVLQKGFTATSIDEIIERSHITKSGFFYHFKGKNELAKRLLQRYLEQDEAFFGQLFTRADELSEDPLQQMLIFLKLFAEAMRDMSGVHPGCLVASYTYESQQFDDDVKALTAEGVLSWRAMFIGRFKNIIDNQPMKIETPLEELADMLTSTIEGGIIVSRVLGNHEILAQQLMQYRNHLRLLFDV